MTLYFGGHLSSVGNAVVATTIESFSRCARDGTAALDCLPWWTEKPS